MRATRGSRPAVARSAAAFQAHVETIQRSPKAGRADSFRKLSICGLPITASSA